MTRQQVLDAFDVEAGRIISPGKFESEPVYVPAIWDSILDGGSDQLLEWPNGESFDVVFPTTAERAEWPEIGADIYALVFSETDQGFVSCDAFTLREWRDVQGRNDRAWHEHELDDNNE